MSEETHAFLREAVARSPQQTVADWQVNVSDAAQRNVLTLDVLRRWSDQNLDVQRNGAPPEHVLIYDQEVAIDGRTLPMPCNYVLLRIIPDAGQKSHVWKRPYFIIDPRAGHGPGIGGFKRDSQVGVAPADRHPVYFVSFRQEPEPGQTLAAVTDAEAAFPLHIGKLHPDSPAPIVVGNRQGSWATAVLAATRPGLAGPIMLNGAPMSYWSRKLGLNTAQLEVGRPVDLKQIRAPIICFASHGDNITPVGQALNWVLDTYSDEHEIEVLGQRILHFVQEDVDL